jgi:hypothetical protein
LDCDLVSEETWAWIMHHFPGLTHFEATGPMVEAARLGDLKRLPRLRGLVLRGRAAGDTTALGPFPGLRHFNIGPYYFEADHLARLAPEVESLNADPSNLGDKMLWSRLRSLQMQGYSSYPLLETSDVKMLALHPLLERLNIRCRRVTVSGIKALADLPRLRELTLRFIEAAPPSLKALAKARSLESLTIEGPISDERFGEIVNITGLRELSLSQVPPTGRGLARLAELQGLEGLRLHGECEDASALAKLGTALPRLMKFDAEYLKMPPEHASALKAACPPWVECKVPAPEQ